MKKIMVMAALMSGFATTALARGGTGGDGIYFGIHVDPIQNKYQQKANNATESDTDTKTMNLDLLLGYKMMNGLYLGGMYESNEVKYDPSGLKVTSGGLAASVGYMNNGFMLIGHYFITAEGKASGGGADDKWTKPTGIGADLGYQFNVSGPFNLGAVLSYRSFEFKKLERAGSETPDSSLKISGYEPKLVFGFMF